MTNPLPASVTKHAHTTGNYQLNQLFSYSGEDIIYGGYGSWSSGSLRIQIDIPNGT
jgi:hypothetical protein